jgi:hypothetical protein
MKGSNDTWLGGPTAMSIPTWHQHASTLRWAQVKATYPGDWPLGGGGSYSRLEYYASPADPSGLRHGRRFGYEKPAHRSSRGQKKAHHLIMAEEKRFKDFARIAADWFWELDADLRFT